MHALCYIVTANMQGSASVEPVRKFKRHANFEQKGSGTMADLQYGQLGRELPIRTAEGFF